MVSDLCKVVNYKLAIDNNMNLRFLFFLKKGMPELRLGLNDKFLFESQGRSKAGTVEMEDVKFHQCVRLFNFERDRTISFIPPDGIFELLSYR